MPSLPLAASQTIPPKGEAYHALMLCFQPGLSRNYAGASHTKAVAGGVGQAARLSPSSFPGLTKW